MEYLKEHRTIYSILLITIMAAAAILCCGGFSYAAGEGDLDGDSDTGIVQHEVHMNPGETYDCSAASPNTTVYIESAGTYRLKGKSNYVRVLIDGGNVTVKLADGLNLNCGINAYGGTRTSPININETGGTVTLVSEKNANIYFEGYMCPAIRKEGLKTALHFETEDPDHPGKIEAHTNKSNFCAGIGSVNYVVLGNGPVGNITINSGNILAQGGNGASGIGGGWGKGLNGLTINGGYIESYGFGRGSGIGGGYREKGWNITINGGTVYAKCSGGYSGCGIGGGGPAEEAHNNMGCDGDVTIHGGDVTAITQGLSAAIGGGGESNAIVNITGGRVYAHVKKDGNAGFTAPAIGAGFGTHPGHARITITGGIVYAQNDKDDCVAIGDHKNSAATTSSFIHISGGTIVAIAKKNKYDIGTHDGETVITGGSIYAKKAEGKVVNSEGEPLHMVEVSLDGMKEDDVRVPELFFKDTSFDYGMKDVYTSQGGKIFPWLPKDNSENNIIAADCDGDYYFGSIKFSETKGTLYKRNKITILPHDTTVGLGSGYAYAVYGQPKLLALRAPDCLKGYHVNYYKLKDDQFNRRLADADGTFSETVSGYTKNGVWDREYSEGDVIELQAVAVLNQYKVKFDSNKPKGASTSVTGEMEELSLRYDQKVELPNSYYLPGYVFQGWNTKADGTGVGYTVGQEVSKLTDKDGDTVTLYAQWFPLSYQVEFDPNGGEGSMEPVTMTFDKAEQLPACTLSLQGCRFAGWQRTHVAGGHIYADQDTVVNLCGSNPEQPDEGEITVSLSAVWMPETDVVVGVFNNDAAVSGLTVELIHETTQNKYTLAADAVPGYYKFVPGPEADPGDAGDGTGDDTDENPPALPEGSYTVSVYDGNGFYDTTGKTINVEFGKGELLILQYCTLEIAGENDKISAWIEDNGSQYSGLSKVPEGSELGVTASAADGYHFDGYSAEGATPIWNPTKANQTITVKGEVKIKARVEANQYRVTLDPNGGNGSMDGQDMIYDEPQNLLPNQYKRDGYTFNGWNTKADGTGQGYDDGATVQNLTTGDAVTLFAVWKPITYKIDYELEEGELPDGKFNPRTYNVESSDFTLINPEKEDYNFDGWTGTDLQKPEKTVTIKKGSLGNRTYTATWSLIRYKVKFDTNGGSRIEDQSVEIHGTAVRPENPRKKGYRFSGWYADQELSKGYDFGSKIEADTTLYAKWEKIPVSALIAQGKTSGKRGVKLSWLKVKGATKYEIYGAACGSEKLQKIGTVRGQSFNVRKMAGKKLKSHKVYKFRITALDDQGAKLAKSKIIHVIASGTMGKNANIETIKAVNKTVSVSVGGTVKVKARYKLPKGKKHLGTNHGSIFTYTSSDPAIATVGKSGTVKGVSAGSAVIYIQDTSGKYCKTTVKVK